ncbi:MAG: hypothetical protein RL580_1058 [Pseudomonadota bacterium]
MNSQMNRSRFGLTSMTLPLILGSICLLGQAACVSSGGIRTKATPGATAREGRPSSRAASDTVLASGQNPAKAERPANERKAEPRAQER